MNDQNGPDRTNPARLHDPQSNDLPEILSIKLASVIPDGSSQRISTAC